MSGKRIEIHIYHSDKANPMWKELWDILLSCHSDDSKTPDSNNMPDNQMVNSADSKKEVKSIVQPILFDLDKMEMKRKNMWSDDREVSE